MGRLAKALILLASVVLAACLPQGTNTGGGALPSPGVLGATQESKTSEGRPEETVAEPLPGAVAGPADNPAAPPPPPVAPPPPGAVAENAQSGMMPSGQAAPSGQVGEDARPLLRGTQTSECSLPDGRVRVHVEARAFGMKADGTVLPMENFSGEIWLRAYFKKPDSGRGYSYADIPLQYPPHEPGALQIKDEPRNYVEFSVATSQPDSMFYYPVKYVDPGFVEGPPPPPKVGGLPFMDEMTHDESRSPLPACFEPKIQVGP